MNLLFWRRKQHELTEKLTLIFACPRKSSVAQTPPYEVCGF